MRRSWRVIVALTLAFALVAGACGSDDEEAAPAATTAAPEEVATVAGSLGYVRVEAGEDIQIRSLNAISGDVAFLGIPNQRGVEMAIANYGPIGGHDVSMGTGLDDLCSADGGQAAAQTIVADEDVVGVIGTSCSGAAAAAAPLISEAGMVMISGSNTSPSLTSDLAGTAGSNNYPGYYRTAHNDLYQGAAAAGFAIDVLGVTTAAAIHDGDPYTQGLAQAFADAFEALGGTITTFTAVNKGDTDMVPVLTEVASGSPELLFFPIFQPEGDFIVQQASDVAGLEGVTMMAADGLLNSNYMAIPETEGMYFSGPDLRYGTNRNQRVIGSSPEAFTSLYVVQYGEKPSAPFWAHSFDATTLLLDAIEAASYDDDGTLVIDRAGVREYLSNVRDYQGLTGLLSCDEFGDCGSQKITVIGHGDSGDVDGSLANVVYEYAPGGGSLGEGNLVVPAPKPQRGGTLRYAIEADVDGLNPTSSAISTSGYVMGAAVFDTLATGSVDGDCIPSLAESFEHNEDYTSWTYKLREGILFHDGNEVTAEDVVYSAEVQRNDPLVGLAVKPFYPTEGAFEVLDRYTVRFNLLDSWANFCPTSQLAWVASKAWLEAALEDPTLDQQPVGSGPFRFDSRTEDSVTRFVRNEGYWGGEAWLDAVEYIPVPDPDTRTDLLLAGEVHALHTTSDENIEILENSDGIFSLRSQKPHGGAEAFLMLNSSVAPFDDIRARKALAYATPKQDYLTLITAGLGVSADQLFEPGSPYHNPAVKQEADMPDEAVAMAAEYCADLPENCSNGKINMEYMFVEGSVVNQRSAELMEKGWSVAFNVDFDLNNQQQHIQNAALGWYNAVAWRQFGAYRPEGDNVWLMCRTVGFISLNWPKYCDEERDALLWEATGTTDEAIRTPLFQELAQKLHDDYLYIFLTHVQWTNSFADNVHGVCEADTAEGHRIFCPNDGVTGVRTLWLSED